MSLEMKQGANLINRGCIFINKFCAKPDLFVYFKSGTCAEKNTVIVTQVQATATNNA